MFKPEELRNEEFDVSVLGGYKRESVDVFLKAVADDYEKLYNENAELVQKLKVCVNKIEEYRKDEQFLKTAIINAEKLNENALRDIENKEKIAEKNAKETAESILQKAKSEAEDIVKRARLDSEESIRAYEINAQKRISEIKESVSAEEKHLEAMKKEVSDFKDMLFKLYKQHLGSISKMPSVSKPEAPKAEENKPEARNKAVAFSEEAAPAEQNPVHESQPAPEPERIPQPEPIQEPAPERHNAAGSSEKTAEFVLEKKPKLGEDSRLHEMFDNSFKFKDLKFGTDFDLNKDE